jgi:hypothetical protein
MLLWSVMVGILGVCGTGVWVTYLSRQRTQYGLQWYWFYGLVALFPAWLVACLSLLTPPSGGGQVFLPTAVFLSSAAGLLGVVGTDAVVRRLQATARTRRPVLYWLLGVASLFPGWAIALFGLLRR